MEKAYVQGLFSNGITTIKFEVRGHYLPVNLWMRFEGQDNQFVLHPKLVRDYLFGLKLAPGNYTLSTSTLDLSRDY